MWHETPPKDLPFVYDEICPKCRKRQTNENGFRYCMDCGAAMKPPVKVGQKPTQAAKE